MIYLLTVVISDKNVKKLNLDPFLKNCTNDAVIKNKSNVTALTQEGVKTK